MNELKDLQKWYDVCKENAGTDLTNWNYLVYKQAEYNLNKHKEELEHKMKGIENLTPLVCLDDGFSTYDEGGYIIFVSDNQLERLDEGSEPKHLDSFYAVNVREVLQDLMEQEMDYLKSKLIKVEG